MKKFFGNVFAVILGNFLTFILIGIFIGAIAMFSLAEGFFKDKGPKSGSVLEITFNSPIKESAMDDEASLFGPPPGSDLYFRDIIRSIHAAKEDDKIKGISLKISSFMGGFSQLNDVRNALLDFKKSGKFIYAYSHNSDQGGYAINSVADSIFQNPLGMVLVQGLSAEVMFYKNLGEKYGIDFQVIRHGAYKSAVEPYMREDLSPENREQLTVLLNEIWGNLATDISKSRKMPVEQFQKAVDSLHSYNPDKALAHKFVDKIMHEGEYDHFIAEKIGLEVKEKDSFYKELKKYSISLEDYATTLSQETSRDQVAIVYASGTIMPGEGYSGIQSEIYKQTLRDLQEDDKVKAVVLRINSPGGSADASEEILYELRQLHKLKPIIVSFGDVAASGGYYIAMESDAIYTNPNTITGSIGVLGMIPSVKKLINNVGITTDYVKTNENSEFLKTIFSPMNDTQMQTMVDMTEGVYKQFVNHVSAARKMSFEEVDAVGGGRVWTGGQAKKIGLVDQLGNLEDAIAAAAKKAELDKYSVTSYPFRKGGLEEFMAQFKTSNAESMIKEEIGAENFSIYQDLKAMKEYKGVQLRMPFDIRFK